MKSNRWFACLCVGIVIGGVSIVVAANRGWFAKSGSRSHITQQEQKRAASAVSKQPDNRKVLAEALGINEDEIVNGGGIERPKRDLEYGLNANRQAESVPRIADLLPPGPRPGRSLNLTGTENPQVEGMVAEMKGHPQLETDAGGKPAQGRVITSWLQPEAFDRAAFAADAQSWLDKIRPSRVFNPAQPGDGVTPLASDSPAFHNLLQGEKVVLRVKAEIGMPVTFYTPQVGRFMENQLTTVTVVADAEGLATATWHAGPGSMGLVDILAASPVHSRQLHFRVKVDLPEQVAGLN